MKSVPLKTIPCSAAHTRLVQMTECPPPPRVDMDQRNANVESDVWQTQTADLQTGRSRGKHCCEILQQIPYP